MSVSYAVVPGSLSGRVCLVTGANTGIGRVTALELARGGAHVFLACRSEAKTTPVVREIREQTKNELVEFLELDLSSLASVRHCAETFLSRELPLHILVNNAGLAGHQGQTQDGFELQFGVNHLGHFLFTELLLDRLLESAPARIVNVSSGSHYDAKGIDFEALRSPTRSITAMPEYQVSKLANVLYAKDLAERLVGTGVTTYSLHPGMVASDIWRRLPKIAHWFMKRRMITNEEGALTSLYCATSDAARTETGLYYDRCQTKKPSRWAEDVELRKDLMRHSREWVGLASEDVRSSSAPRESSQTNASESPRV